MARNTSQPANKSDVKQIVNEVVMDASDKILKGMDKMFKDFKEWTESKFATKDELAKVALDVSWIKDEIEKHFPSI